jgi:hypothetical protein
MPEASITLAWHFNLCGCDRPTYAR